MRLLIILSLLAFNFINAQSVDYNLKKGYVAEGYDVVAYFSNEAVKGDKKYTSTYDGVKYQFASQKNLNTF